MKHMTKIISLAVLAALFSTNVFAYGTGISTFPLEVEKKFISAEVTGITSEGGGIGLQTRFTTKLNEKTTVDAGLGISGGERSARLFAGFDYELFPDYQMQPRTSLKAFVENSKEFNIRRNIIGFAPTFSKGFSFWEHEAFPYLAIPLGISLNGRSNTYATTVSANFGISGVLPVQTGAKKLTANAELLVGLKDSFSGLFMGIAYPIE
jgi:hypothetical protein